MIVKRTIAVLTASLACTTITTAAAPPALADRCEPDEVVVRVIPGMGDYESPDDPADPTVCNAMQRVVYNNVDCDDTTLMSCVQTGTRRVVCTVVFNCPPPIDP